MATRRCKECVRVLGKSVHYNRQFCSTSCRDRASRRRNAVYIKKYQASSRKYLLVLRYGITVEQYNLLLEKQKGACAICQRVRRLNVDHDHATGRVRGLLCHGCNIGIGFIERATPKHFSYLGLEVPKHGK